MQHNSNLPSKGLLFSSLSRPEAILTTQRHTEDNRGTAGTRVPIKSRSYKKFVFVYDRV